MAKSLIRSQFGSHAAKYATSAVHAKGASLKRLVELVRPQAHWRALDIATGAGHTALAFAPHLRHVVASDLTPEMLDEVARLAAARGAENVTTALSDAESLSFEDESFDLVTCRIAAHHFADVPAFLSQTWRVLKPGGIFALVDNISPDANSTPGFSDADLRDAAQRYNAIDKIRDPSHGRSLTLGEWKEAIGGAGFDLRRAERLAKEMAFTPWAERMGASAKTIKELRALFAGAPKALAAFLRQRRDNGELIFTIDEALIIACKAA